MGYDYGMGQYNLNTDTGIRYGVIHHGEVGSAWYDSSEGSYPEPEQSDWDHCPDCGHPNQDPDSNEPPDDTPISWGDSFQCDECGTGWEVQDDMLEPTSHVYDAEGIQAEQGYDSPDIFVYLSPYYTRCDYCSPCAPGAGYLTSEGEDCKAYCFGHDWFYDHPEHPGRAPYRVFRVSDDSEVFPEVKK